MPDRYDPGDRTGRTPANLTPQQAALVKRYSDRYRSKWARFTSAEHFDIVEREEEARRYGAQFDYPYTPEDTDHDD